MSKELIREAQEQIMFARAHVESTFMDPMASTELLANHARIHGQLTAAILTLQDAMTEATEPQLPKLQAPPKKKHNAARSERRAKARQAAAKGDTPKRPPAMKNDALGVECPQCKQPRGQFCVVTTTSGVPTDRMLTVNGGFHAQRREAAGVLKGKGKLVPWTPPQVVEPPDDEPARFDDGTPMDGLASEQEVMELLGQTFPDSEMVVIDGVGVDVDRVRALVDGQ